MSNSSQAASPQRGQELRTSDTTLITSFTTQVGISENGPDLRHQDRALEENFVRSRPHMISSINSLLDFVNYYSMLPVENMPNLYKDENTSGFLYDPDINIVGRGLSFVVQAEKNYPVPDYLMDRIPSWQGRNSKPLVAAVKIPRIDKRELLHPNVNIETRCLRAIAWECHVLSHPSIRACRNIIDLFGITWRPAFARNAGKRRLLPALVLEFASEGTLSNIFKSGTFCLTYATKLGLILDVAIGLEVLHRHGIVHGDVKAENVLLTSNSEGELVAKITDFACSIHDFGATGQQRMPGKSPPLGCS